MDKSEQAFSNYYIPNENDLGYKFYPRQYPDAPGHPRLDIVLRKIPTLQHYDPETLLVKVVSSKGGIERHIIHHPWQSRQVRFRLVAGRIIWQDRVHKVKEAFTFGADLEIKSLKEGTICILTSPAPIIPLTNELAFPTLFALEVETLIAVRRAAWVHDTGNYIRRLCNADPQNLYQASLRALSEKLETFTKDSMTEPISQLNQFVHHEQQANQKESKTTLQDIL